MNKTAALPVGVALVVIGVAIFTVPAFSSGPGSQITVQAASQHTATKSPTAPPAEVSPVPTTQAHAAHLTERLAATKVVSAGYKLSAAAPAKVSPLEFHRIGEDSSAGYKASAVLTDATGQATLSVFVRSASKPHACTPENNCVVATPVPDPPNVPKASESTVDRADGTKVLVTRNTGADGKVTMLAAEARHIDGTVVTAVVRAEVEEMTGKQETVSTRDSVPLTEEQVIDLAVLPGFHY